jgi:putative component of membrane protein insertase Oxa1/YidC/SpoIIIJ protein YidD
MIDEPKNFSCFKSGVPQNKGKNVYKVIVVSVLKPVCVWFPTFSSFAVVDLYRRNLV